MDDFADAEPSPSVVERLQQRRKECSTVPKLATDLALILDRALAAFVEGDAAGAEWVASFECEDLLDFFVDATQLMSGVRLWESAVRAAAELLRASPASAAEAAPAAAAAAAPAAAAVAPVAAASTSAQPQDAVVDNSSRPIPQWPTNGKRGRSTLVGELYLKASRKGRCIADGGSGRHRWVPVCVTCETTVLKASEQMDSYECVKCRPAPVPSPPQPPSTLVAPAPQPTQPSIGDEMFLLSATALCFTPTGVAAQPPIGDEWVGVSPLSFRGVRAAAAADAAQAPAALLRHVEAATFHRLGSTAVVGFEPLRPHRADQQERYADMLDEQQLKITRVASTAARIGALPFAHERVQRGSGDVRCISHLDRSQSDYYAFSMPPLDDDLQKYAQLRLREALARSEMPAAAPSSEPERAALKRTLARACTMAGASNDLSQVLTPIAKYLNAPRDLLDAAPAAPQGGGGVVVVTGQDAAGIGAGFAWSIATSFSRTNFVCVYPTSSAAVVDACTATRQQHAALYADLDPASFVPYILSLVCDLAHAGVLESQLALWARAPGSGNVVVDGKYVPVRSVESMLWLQEALCVGGAVDLPDDADTQQRIDRIRSAGSDANVSDLQVLSRRIAVASDRDAVERHESLASLADELLAAHRELRREVGEADFAKLTRLACARPPHWWSGQDRIVPSLRDMRQLLDEMPGMTQRILVNMAPVDLDHLPTPPSLGADVREQLRDHAAAAAAPELVPRLWAALHTHAAALLTSPTVELSGKLPDALSTVIDSLGRREAVYAAALLAAAEGCYSSYAQLKQSQLDLPRLYAAVREHTLHAGRNRTAKLAYAVHGEQHAIRLDDAKNRIATVPEWDNARCSAAAIVWCLNALRSVHAHERRHPLYYLLPLLKGGPRHGDPEGSRVALGQFPGVLKILKVIDKTLPAHQRQLEDAARKLLKLCADRKEPGVDEKVKHYNVSASFLRKLYAA